MNGESVSVPVNTNNFTMKILICLAALLCVAAAVPAIAPVYKFPLAYTSYAVAPVIPAVYKYGGGAYYGLGKRLGYGCIGCGIGYRRTYGLGKGYGLGRVYGLGRGYGLGYGKW